MDKPIPEAAVDALYDELFRVGRYLHAPVPIDPKGIIRRHLAAAQQQGGGEVEYEFEVWQDNSLQAGGSTPDYDTAKSEADHYALMYGQDGPVEVRMYVKRQITSPPSAPVGAAEEMVLDAIERRAPSTPAGFSVYAALRSIRYNAENGSQDRPLHVRLQLIAEDARRAIAACEAAPPSAPVEAVRYDAGLLSDYGGGNVEWWQDYIRAELERAHDFYTEALAQQPAAIASLSAPSPVRALASECPDCLNDGCACSKCNPHPGDQQASAPVGVENVAENAARALYAEWCDAQDIHSNRFPAWYELSEAKRSEWFNRVVEADTGNREADNLIGRLMHADPTFSDCADGAALIRKLARAAAQQPAADPYRVLFERAMDTAHEAMEYIQTHAEQFGACPGDDKLAIVCREFLKAQQPAAEVVVTRDDDGEIIRVTQGGKVIAATTHAGGKQPAAVDKWRLVIYQSDKPGIWATDGNSFVWVAELATQHQGDNT